MDRAINMFTDCAGFASEEEEKEAPSVMVQLDSLISRNLKQRGLQLLDDSGLHEAVQEYVVKHTAQAIASTVFHTAPAFISAFHAARQVSLTALSRKRRKPFCLRKKSTKQLKLTLLFLKSLSSAVPVLVLTKITQPNRKKNPPWMLCTHLRQKKEKPRTQTRHLPHSDHKS